MFQGSAPRHCGLGAAVVACKPCQIFIQNRHEHVQNYHDQHKQVYQQVDSTKRPVLVGQIMEIKLSQERLNERLKGVDECGIGEQVEKHQIRPGGKGPKVSR